MNKDQILQYRGQTLYDRDGDKVGSIDEIDLDAETNEPEWALVHTGLFGTKRTFVPLRDATERDGNLAVQVEKSQIKDAPGIEGNGQLSQREESELYAHYGLEFSEARSDTGLPEGGAGTTGTARGVVGNDVSGQETDDAMTRSEEELRVGTTEREAGRARLRKYVVTEDVQQTVPVKREEARIEREPITDANVGDAMDGPAISEEEHEVVLHEEQVVADKRAVPKERVRLEKDTVTEEERVSDEVRKERIETEGGIETERGTRGDDRL